MNRRPKKKGFEKKFEILGTVSQPRVLSADMPARWKGGYLFYNRHINFCFVRLKHVFVNFFVLSKVAFEISLLLSIPVDSTK